MTAATPTALPSLLKSTLGRMLGAVLNRMVALDPELPARLAPLEGRSLGFHLAAPPLAFTATLREGRFEIGPPLQPDESDLSLSSSLGALFSQLMPGKGHTATVGRMRINGDAELAQLLQKLIHQYQPDIEGQFVAVFGDVLGVQMARALKQGFDAVRDGGKAFARDGAEFLTEESRDVVGKEELNAFCDDVDELRDDVERVERRMQRLGLIE